MHFSLKKKKRKEKEKRDNVENNLVVHFDQDILPKVLFDSHPVTMFPTWFSTFTNKLTNYSKRYPIILFV